MNSVRGGFGIGRHRIELNGGSGESVEMTILSLILAERVFFIMK